MFREKVIKIQSLKSCLHISTVFSYNNHMCINCVYCRTAELQDKIRSVQDDIQRINTCIEEHESERSTRYRELRKKEQVFKGTHALLNFVLKLYM